ncbi:hypothetical protein PG999_014476 [Apiospora kogelbergensis]|uniref:2EXR domain-containing protein n=1 Tax=Apiospora kogelbergensis TaxID=1337665 RepID=A0AAW0Q500_9PEZI
MDFLTSFQNALKWVSKPFEPAEFKQFSRLPVEVRLMIWRASWTPKVIQSKAVATRGHDHVHSYPGKPKRNLPVTLWVNRESRKETRRWYRKITNQFVDSYFNEEMDTLRLYSCKLNTLGPSTLFRVQSLILSTCDSDSYWLQTPRNQPQYMTMGNLLHNFKPRYMPSLTHLKLEAREYEIGKVRKALRDSIRRPLFFRYEGGAGGVWIVPNLEWRRCSNGGPHTRYSCKLICPYLMGIEVYFWGPRKAACFIREEARAAKHRAWLQFVSFTLWRALVLGLPLAKDAVDALVTGRQTDYLQ